jgi:phosphoglycolate phosphatase
VPIKGIIFDFDNTLVKSNIDFTNMKRHMARAAREKGLDFGDEEEIPHKYTAGALTAKAEAFDRHNGGSLATLLWEIVEEYEKKGMEDITIDSSIKTTLADLKQQGLQLAILTNNAKKPTIQVLDTFHLLDFFDIILARDDVKQMKPDPEGIIAVLDKLALQPETVVFVGDSWVDGKAAKNAGVMFIHISELPLDPNKHQDIPIWRHITDLSELEEIIRKKEA